MGNDKKNEVKKEPELITSFEKLEKQKKLDKENSAQGPNPSVGNVAGNSSLSTGVGEFKNPQMSKSLVNDDLDSLSDSKVKDFINSVLVLILVLVFVSILAFIALSYTGRLQLSEYPILDNLLSNFSF